MERVFRIQGKGKMKDVGLRGLATHPAIEDANTTVTLIQALIPLGLRADAGFPWQEALSWLREFGLPTSPSLA